MACDSPQLLLGNGKGKALEQPCGLCFSCTGEKLAADRQRKLYWLRKKRGVAHA